MNLKKKILGKTLVSKRFHRESETNETKLGVIVACGSYLGGEGLT